jgi:phosphoenolpyruvate phosphomutase / 2-hydroxyethylphosphonate cytidylyltransferase
MKTKNIYIGLSLDIIHHGHINLINKAKNIGKLTVGLFTDKAIASHKRLPLLQYEDRKKILENIKGVYKVVPQNEWNYSSNILKYKPDIMVHGDDWKLSEEGKKLREDTMKALKKINATLIEIPYTKNVSSEILQSKMFQQGLIQSTRQSYLKRLIELKNICRILETHSPLSAIIAEKTNYINKNGKKIEFDGFWSSSLTDSTLRGKPDIEVLDLNQRLSNINDIFDVTTKPLIMDIDTGGRIEHLEINIKTLERSGVSAAIMEDKKGLKKNSLFGAEVKQEQESIKEFSKKIALGKKATNKDLMLIARVESLILNKPISDALRRACSYVDSGADGIMIHSRAKTPKEIFQFSKKFKKIYPNIPLVAVPSSYNKVKENQLIDNGFNIVIYANHMLRASYPSMRKVALEILKNKRSYESDNSLLSIKDILDLIPGTK